MARLRYLGVPFKEPLSVGAAGVLIDKGVDDPAFARRIEQWHRDKYSLHPDLYPASERPTVDHDSAGRATSTSPLPRRRGFRAALRRLALILCALAVAGAGWWIYSRWFLAGVQNRETPRKSISAGANSNSTPAGTPLPVASPPRKFDAPNVVPGPVLPKPALTVGEAFAADVRASQTRAAARYPALRVLDSPLNLRFRVRLDEWRARGDVRLTKSDWPEQLAAEVAAMR